MTRKEKLFAAYPDLAGCEAELDRALAMMLQTYREGGKLLLCGNGGSSADCDHIAGELMKGFLSLRPIPQKDKNLLMEAFPQARDSMEQMCVSLQRGIPALSLPSMSSVLTAYANDVSADLMYAQLVYALARPEDMLIAISTSGNSKNVLAAARLASAMGIRTLGMTGQRSCLLDSICGCVIKVPASETYRVQEYHLPVYHYLCAEIEAILFGEA